MPHAVNTESRMIVVGRPFTIWVLRAVVAAILLPYAYLKLSGAETFVSIFQMLGAEPIGRYLTAALEITTVLLLMIPRMAVQGAVTGIVVMLGAIGSHLFVTGIAVHGDHGMMFLLACSTLLTLTFLVILRDRLV